MMWAKKNSVSPRDLEFLLFPLSSKRLTLRLLREVTPSYWWSLRLLGNVI